MAQNGSIVVFEFFFVFSEISFVYLIKAADSISSATRELKMYLVVYTPKRNGISLGANQYQTFLHLGPPYMDKFRISFTVLDEVSSSLASFNCQHYRLYIHIYSNNQDFCLSVT